MHQFGQIDSRRPIRRRNQSRSPVNSGADLRPEATIQADPAELLKMLVSTKCAMGPDLEQNRFTPAVPDVGHPGVHMPPGVPGHPEVAVSWL